MLVPLTAVSGNIDFLCSRDKETRLECSGGVICKVRFVKTIHVLTEEFDVLLQDIYGRRKKQDLLYFLKEWYGRLEHKFSSFEFIYIEAYEPQTETVPE